MITRVLRPATLTARPTVEGQTVDGTNEELPSMDSADANAIEEVNVAYENVKEVDCLDLSKEGTDSWEAALRR